MRRSPCAAAGAALAAALVACSPAPPPAAPPVAAASAAASNAALLFPPRPAASAIAQAQPLRVRAIGVVQRPGGGEALLAVDGGAAQVYPAGAAVVDGWHVDTVAGDYVILARGDARERLEVVGGTAAPATASASQAGGAKPKDEPLPGFVAGAPPPGMAPAAGNESNQRFRQLHQKK